MAQGLPEESGIGALPAPNMRGYAAGGIVAFADGGFNSELFRKFLESVGKTGSDFANADSATRKGLLDAFGRATSGPQMSAPAPSVPSAPSVPGNPYAPATPGASYESTQGARGAGALRNLSAAAGSGAGMGVLAGGSLLSRAAAGNLSSRSNEELDTLSESGGGDDTSLAAAIMREGRNTPTPTPAAPAKPGDYRGSKNIPYAGTGIASPSAAALRSGASTQASQAARANAAPRVNTGAGTGAPLAPSAGAMSIAELQRLQASLAPTGAVADPYAAENAEKAKLREDQANLELADSETRKAGLAGLLAPKEARIKAREDRLQKSDDMNLNMSLINAGLAMMQSRGQGLAGIAEGANVGVKQYSEGLKMSEAARQKIEDAKDAFDELKFNQTNMSQKEVTAAKRTIAEGAIASKNETIAGIKEATGAKTKAAEAIFSSYVQSRDSAADRASRERTAAFSAQVQREIAAMPGANERLYSTLGGGDVKKGFDYLNAATAEGKGDEAIMQAVIKSPEILGAINPALRKVIEQRIADRFAPQVQNKAGDRP